MNKQIKRLQKLLTDGKIDQAEYAEQLQELLEDNIVTQEDFDGAKEFKPVNEDDKPIYSQADVDAMIVPKARKMVKKALSDAGVDLTGIENKDLLNSFGTLALQGQKKGNLTVDEAGLADLQKKAKAFDDLQPKVKGLTMENAVLKAAGTYNPLNPKQVVRALDDYSNLLDYDEDENLDPKSVDRALSALVKAEPNLFKTVEAGSRDDHEEGGSGTQQGFTGKSPGGAGATGGSKVKDKEAKLQQQALEMMGIKTQETKQF